MPEGDTIWRAARTLYRALEGRRVLGARSSVPGVEAAAMVGRWVARTESRGKNLLIHFDDGSALLTHMRMTGSWHIYRPGEEWGKAPTSARVMLETDEWVAVCFNAPVVELLTPLSLNRQVSLQRLGPDILGEPFDGQAVADRLKERGTVPIGEAVMLQAVVAGIGNVYKCETLFLCNMNPWMLVEHLTDTELKRIIGTARQLMRSNLETPMRTTRQDRPGGRLWVYGRAGMPCRRCGCVIGVRRQGLQGRTTYWCQACQKPGERSAQREQ